MQSMAKAAGPPDNMQFEGAHDDVDKKDV